LIEDYRRGLAAAGFSNVQVVDSGADLNAYAKLDNQPGCCSPASSAASAQALPVVATGCCTPATQTAVADEMHERLVDLLHQYNVNDYACSVKVYAVK
jgi:hypothetical protein